MPEVPATRILTVSEITRRIKGLLERDFPSVWLEGEVSNLRSPGSGHVYFTLKDAGAQIAAVLFRGVAAKVNFKLKDGLQIIAFGDISVYERQGQYQVILRQVLPKGLGALQLAFEELKRKLQAEGLFDETHKQPLPALPQRIGLVTSPTGAAIRDFLNIIARRFPNVHIIIYPVRVQGDGAAQEIAAAIDHFNALHATGALPLDVVIVTRGGGSLEDLWAFNEEVVARALYRSLIPTISAVGHEIDFTIADFVADLRAPTPSAAAELVVTAKEVFLGRLQDYRQRLTKDLRLRLAELRQRYTTLATSYVFRQPAELVRQYQQRVDDHQYRLRQTTAAWLDARRARLDLTVEKVRLLSPTNLVLGWRKQLETQHQRLATAVHHRHREAAARLDQLRGQLDLLSPKGTLQRGYSITRAADGRVIKTVQGVHQGETIRTLLTDGEFESVVS